MSYLNIWYMPSIVFKPLNSGSSKRIGLFGVGPFLSFECYLFWLKMLQKSNSRNIQITMHLQDSTEAI